MMTALLLIGDGFFWLFHTALCAFNLFGWLWRRTRRLTLICQAATLVSWLIMGLWNGIGYCICTDFHFQIRDALGIRDGADSYVQLLVRKISGWNPPIDLVNNAAGICMLIAVLGCVAFNIMDWRRGRKPSGTLAA